MMGPCKTATTIFNGEENSAKRFIIARLTHYRQIKIPIKNPYPTRNAPESKDILEGSGVLYTPLNF
jgi:hypothetical protein